MPYCIRELEICNQGHVGRALLILGFLWALFTLSVQDQEQNQNEMYNELYGKVFRKVRTYLKVPLHTSSMLVFHCCVCTKINVSALLLLPHHSPW